MKRGGRLRTRTPKRQRLDREAAVEISALMAMTDRCEWCGRRRPLQPHHVAQGFRYKAVGDVLLVLLLCDECHDDMHELPGCHARAVGLALLHHAGRGGVEHFYTVTGRRWPDEALVETWIHRVVREA